MSEDELELAKPDPRDLLIAELGGIVVLDGPQEAIERFRSLHTALDRATPVLSTSAVVLAAAEQLAGVASRPGTSQQLFQLDQKGLDLFRNGELTRSTVGEGWFRAIGKGKDGFFNGQASLRPVDIAPQDLLTAQLALTTVALTAAIKEVAEAVERVERKLESLNDLVTSQVAGGILGAHEALARRAEQTVLTGAMADADWASIQGVGVQVEQQIATLRTFVRKRLKAAAGQGMGVKDRRDAIEHVAQISEMLALLAVAQHSLFLFQAARLHRLRSHEPDHLPAALAEAKQLLERHADEDQALLQQCREIVADRLQVKPLELYRYVSAREVVRLVGETDSSLEWFAGQRSVPYEALPASVLPTVGEAIDEVKARGTVVVDGARVAGDVVRTKVARRDRSKSPDPTPAASDDHPAAD